MPRGRVPARPGRVTSSGSSLSLGLSFLGCRGCCPLAASSRKLQGHHPGPSLGSSGSRPGPLPRLGACVALGLRFPRRPGGKAPGATQAPTPPPRPAHPPAPPSRPRPSDNLYGPSSSELRVPRAVAQSASARARKPELGRGRSASVETPPPRAAGRPTQDRRIRKCAGRVVAKEGEPSRPLSCYPGKEKRKSVPGWARTTNLSVNSRTR